MLSKTVGSLIILTIKKGINLWQILFLHTRVKMHISMKYTNLPNESLFSLIPYSLDIHLLQMQICCCKLITLYTNTHCTASALALYSNTKKKCLRYHTQHFCNRSNKVIFMSQNCNLIKICTIMWSAVFMYDVMGTITHPVSYTEHFTEVLLTTAGCFCY